MILKKFKNIRVKKGDDIIYLGIELSRLQGGSVQISMIEYTEKVVSEWRDMMQWKTEKRAVTPALDTLFEVNTESPFLSDSQREIFHTFTAKGLYLAKEDKIGHSDGY